MATAHVLVRVWLPDRPGALGQVASRIGSLRGDIVGVDGRTASVAATAGDAPGADHLEARARGVPRPRWWPAAPPGRKTSRPRRSPPTGPSSWPAGAVTR